ncbi:MAG TPA: hypothetical protein VEB21_00055 [Terriglobales bacterium]|nr:hypothetical protein [Terriglobales bacterium]
MGGRVEVDSLDIRVDRLDCDETYVYRSKAGVCGEAMSYLRGGEAGFIATLAGNGQITFFGGGFDIRSHWVSDGAPESLKGEIPLVGPGICSIGGEGCSQPLTPLGGEACSSDSAGACCSDRSAVCQERKNLDDPSNLHVYRAGDHADYQSCQQLQTQLGADAAAVAALAPNHADYSNIQTPQKIRLRAQKIASPSHCEMGQPDACSAACAASCTVMLGAGQQVLYLDSVDVGKSTELRLCRDFGLSESDPPTVAIVRIEKNLKLGGGGKITACGVPPDRILWNAEGARGAVKLSAKASLAGTILAPGRRSVTVGGGARIDGSLYTQKVAFKKDAKLFHYPFSAGVE